MTYAAIFLLIIALALQSRAVRLLLAFLLLCAGDLFNDLSGRILAALREEMGDD